MPIDLLEQEIRQPLRYPAPSRVWYRTETNEITGESKWTSRPWQADDIADYKAFGGHFVAGRHDLYSPPATEAEKAEAARLRKGKRNY